MIRIFKTFACATTLLTLALASAGDFGFSEAVAAPAQSAADSASASAGDFGFSEAVAAPAQSAADAESLASPHAVIRRGRSFGSLGEAGEDGGFSPGLGRRSGSTVEAPEGYELCGGADAVELSPQMRPSPQGELEIAAGTVVSIPPLRLDSGAAMTGCVLRRKDTDEFYLSGPLVVIRGAITVSKGDGITTLGPSQTLNVRGHFAGTPSKLPRRRGGHKGGEYAWYP